MPDIQSPLDQSLYTLTMEHLARIAEYVPGPVKKRGTRELLLSAYQQDPVFSIFGLDSPEYLSATLSGGTVTSIHRKIGDIYEACVKAIFMQALNQSPLDVVYSTIIRSGSNEENRSADAFLRFDRLDDDARQRVSEYCQTEVEKLTSSPRIDLVGVAMEIRHCYQTGDSKLLLDPLDKCANHKPKFGSVDSKGVSLSEFKDLYGNSNSRPLESYSS